MYISDNIIDLLSEFIIFLFFNLSPVGLVIIYVLQFCNQSRERLEKNKKFFIEESKWLVTWEESFFIFILTYDLQKRMFGYSIGTIKNNSQSINNYRMGYISLVMFFIKWLKTLIMSCLPVISKDLADLKILKRK